MHADWIDAGLHRAAERAQPPVIQRGAAGLAQHVVGERSAVAFGLESQHVEPAHRADQFGVRRIGHEDRGRGKRRVQEQPDAIAQPRRPQCLRQAQQMVVVRPDQVVRPHQFHERLGEQFVHTAITGELGPVEMRMADLIMQRRPQRSVGEAAIELVVVAAHEIDGEQRDRPHRPFGTRRGGGVVGDLTAPAEPDAAVLLQGIEHTGRKATGRRFTFRDRRHPVGYDDQTGHSLGPRS
jgi:hypothetical protein